ncbi:MAG TPA: cobalamin-independent methionine synthase II family protein [Vicinamibacterales bacterium]
MSLPLFPVTTVGSWPRPASVVEAMRAHRHRRIDRAERDRVADRAVTEWLRVQETLGCDIVTDGELRRDNFYSFVAEKLSGVQLMTLAEMLEVVEDKAGFEQLLQTLDVPAYSISGPVCTGQIARRETLALDDLRFARRHTALPIKVTLPGPYLLTRAMYVPEVTREFYADKEALATAVVALLRAELGELRSAGVEFVQFDEPVLTEVAFAPGRTRTFMCAALAARKDPAEELEFAVSLINGVVAGIDDVRLGLHVCRGNWSRDERTLLSGSYQALRPYLDRLQVRQLVLEYATDRAGGLVAFENKELGLGVVNPRTDVVETPAEIRSAVELALRVYPAERLFLNPDCGFGTFSNRPMNTPEIASAKITAMAAAARDLRSGR